MPTPVFAIDFYSGYLEDVLQNLGSRDVTLVERFHRLGPHTQRQLGLPDALMNGWEDAVERLIMNPPDAIERTADAVAFASLLLDAGQRRFRILVDDPDDAAGLPEILAFLGQPAVADHLRSSSLRGYVSPSPHIRWGFVDVSQVEQLLLSLFGDDTFKTPRTAAIAGRLSSYSRQEAERRLIEIGIETQNSVSHNIDYLIIGSKGTGGTKHDKVRKLQDGGHAITVLDEDGFERLLNPPRPPPDDWPDAWRARYHDLVNALRHVWAFELDLYTLSYSL